ncbi:hypothetical protein Tco_0290584 [Tanacetum coccineum]
MAALTFASSHNMVAFLDKPTESDRFEQIVDFLNAHPIKYALTVNPTVYTSCIEQFWATAKMKTLNEEVQIQALVDKKKVIITETSVRSDIKLEDAEGNECLPNATIFEQLTLMGAKTTAWRKCSSTMASSIICLAKNQKFNFSKYIFDNMVKNLEGGVKFLMYPRVTPLFPTMMVQAQEEVEEQSRRKQRNDTKVSLLSDPTKLVTYKTENVASVPTTSNDPLLSEVTLIDETQERNDDNLMFNTGVLDEQEVDVEKVVSTAEVTTASATTKTVDELTLAQTLIEIKAAKPKAITTAATTTTTTVTRSKARGVIVQEPSEFTSTSSQPSQLPLAKDKGKAKIIKPKEPLKKKDQIMFDKEVAQKLQDQLKVELEEEEKLAKQRKEDANIAEWDDV